MSRWYIIHAYSGFENQVRDAILSEAKRLGLDARDGIDGSLQIVAVGAIDPVLNVERHDLDLQGGTA